MHWKRLNRGFLPLLRLQREVIHFSQLMKDLLVAADTKLKAIKEISTKTKFSDITKNVLSMTLLLSSYLNFVYNGMGIGLNKGRNREKN